MFNITPEYKTNNLADNVLAREYEIYHYQVNIDNYTAMLAALPTDSWDTLPDDVRKWQGFRTEDLPATLPVELVIQLADLQYRDRLRALIRTEAVEQNKAKRVRDALLSQIPADQQAAALAAAATRRAPAVV